MIKRKDEKEFVEVTYWRHKTIQRFQVGRFLFTKGVCVVRTEEVEEFDKAIDSLQFSDRVNIVQVESLSPEFSVEAARARRGTVTASGSKIDATKIREDLEAANLKNTELADKVKQMEAAKEAVAKQSKTPVVTNITNNTNSTNSTNNKRPQFTMTE